MPCFQNSPLTLYLNEETMTQATQIFQEDFEEEQNTIEQDFEHEDSMIETRDFSQNQVLLTFSWSLMNQLRGMARNEGIPVETLLIELAAEGMAKRVFEDQNRPSPSHLMTRNGYVHDADAQHPPQPQMSHHSNMNTNRAQTHHQNNRGGNKYPFQQRNNNGNGYNRNYQGNNRQNQPNFRTNANSYQNGGQQRFRNANNQGNSVAPHQDENQNYQNINPNQKDNKR